LGVYLLGIKLFPRNKNNSKKNIETSSENGNTEEKAKKDLKNTLTGVTKIIDVVYSSSKKHLVIDNLYVSYKFGLGDAALTGIYSGAVYAIFHSFGGYLYSNFKVKQQKIDITPDFDNIKNELKINLYFKIRIINLCTTLIKLVKVL
jgi:hypothetical protein